jgi:hypothetical protein
MDASTIAGFALRTSARARAQAKPPTVAALLERRSHVGEWIRARSARPWSGSEQLPLSAWTRAATLHRNERLDKKTLLWYTLLLWMVWTGCLDPRLRHREVSWNENDIACRR